MDKLEADCLSGVENAIALEKSETPMVFAARGVPKATPHSMAHSEQDRQDSLFAASRGPRDACLDPRGSPCALTTGLLWQSYLVQQEVQEL